MAKWIIDPTHSEVQFKVKHLVISTVTGFFRQFNGEMEAEKDDFTDAKIRFTADVNSVDTNQPERDNHLKSADFFDAANYPQISFHSTEIIKQSDSNYVLKGDLTIKDITKPVELKVEFGGISQDFYGNTKAGFEVTGKINRQDYGLKWSAITEAGSIVVSDEVKLIMSIQMTKQA